MRSTLDEVVRQIGELRGLVASIGPVNAALRGHEDSLVPQYLSIRRGFDYAAFVVALYASFEKFVENLITEFVQIESRRVTYADLPKSLRDKHLSGTAELVLRPNRLGTGRYAGLNERQVVKNLADCLADVVPYELNASVITAHDANLRAGDVDALFALIGLEKICDRACRADALVAWYSELQGSEEVSAASLRRTVIDERLADLVERRNQVAHRGSPTDLLGSDAMGETVGFIEGLTRSIFGIVVGQYLKAHHAASPGRIEMALREGEGPYRKGTVVVVDKPAHRLFVGQAVFVLVESTGARWGRIQSLQVDGSAVADLPTETPAPSGVGIGLDFKFPKAADAKLVALACDDDIVWAPLPTAE